jgi:hypothetical protein
MKDCKQQNERINRIDKGRHNKGEMRMRGVQAKYRKTYRRSELSAKTHRITFD